jgi:hypothetical protein
VVGLIVRPLYQDKKLEQQLRLDEHSVLPIAQVMAHHILGANEDTALYQKYFCISEVSTTLQNWAVEKWGSIEGCVLMN